VHFSHSQLLAVCKIYGYHKWKFTDLNNRKDNYSRNLFVRGLFNKVLIISGYRKITVDGAREGFERK